LGVVRAPSNCERLLKERQPEPARQRASAQ
jgi:hypothetical protein